MKTERQWPILPRTKARRSTADLRTRELRLGRGVQEMEGKVYNSVIPLIVALASTILTCEFALIIALFLKNKRDSNSCQGRVAIPTNPEHPHVVCLSEHGGIRGRNPGHPHFIVPTYRFVCASAKNIQASAHWTDVNPHW